VDVLALYETLAEPLPAHVLREALAADYIAFTSASTVRFFLDALARTGVTMQATPSKRPVGSDRGEVTGASAAPGPDGLPSRARIVSIGPITSAALRERGVEPHVEADTHDLDGLVQALLDDASARGD
jgi:uroporphyrinogen III methyltransferase/synthase